MPWKYLPLGELKVDAGRFANDGLIVARNVVPWHGTLIPTPNVSGTPLNTAANIDTTTGAYVHPGTGAGYLFHAGDDGADGYIYRASTDFTRLASKYDKDAEWYHFCSFGDIVVATNYLDAVQYLPSGGANFADMITSTFAPQARFCAPIGPNLFLANLYLSGAYDDLSGGDNPYTMAWSMDDNLRSFGSPRVNPSFTGAGYKILLNDLGHITGLVGGDYGICFQQRGFTRIDGPPYSFSNFPGPGTLWPLSCGRFGNDVYFWSTSHGPARLVNGVDYQPLGYGRIARYVTSYSQPQIQPALMPVTTLVLQPAFFADANCGVVGWSYASLQNSDLTVNYCALLYNVADDRFSIQVLAVENTLVTPLVAVNTDIGGGTAPLEQARYMFGGDVYQTDETATVTWGGNSTESLIQTSFQSLADPDAAAQTRVLRVRPVYSCTQNASSSSATDFFSVQVATINRMHGSTDVQPFFSSTFTQRDSEDFFPITNSVFGRFHSIYLRPLRPSDEYYEIDGIEVEYETTSGGGRAHAR